MRPSMPPRERPPSVLDERIKSAFYWATAVLSVGALVVAVIKCFAATDLDWPETALLAVAVAGTVATLARQLTLLHAVCATILIAIAGGGLATLNARTGLPFGPCLLGQKAGEKIFNILPWSLPMLWPVAILSSRGVARLILRPWRKTKTYGFRLIGLAAVLTAFFDFTLEPFAASHLSNVPGTFERTSIFPADDSTWATIVPGLTTSPGFKRVSSFPAKGV